MDKQDKHRFVQQYVERQKAYLPTYTAEHFRNECHGTPSKPLQNGEYGFDTPVLCPRVPLDKTSRSQLTLQVGPSKSRARELEARSPPRQGPHPASRETPSEKDKPRPKRKKASTQVDSDNERAARLADRRERKRKKRAIVNSPRKHDDDVPAEVPPKGRTNSQKAKKKPGALALLYGFSATNVTKDRLTVKPAPFLGVFNKGRASAKKKVAVARKSSSRNEVFSESAFLNKPYEQDADHSKVDNGLDDSLVSSTSEDPPPQATRAASSAKKNWGKGTVLETPQTPVGTTAGSEVWDIELQSKLPSSAQDASSETRKNVAPVILDLRGAEWTASVSVAEKREADHSKTSAIRNRSSVVRSYPLVGSDPCAVGAPSIHPSHSASQVGRGGADIQPCNLRPVTSKYFTSPERIPVQEVVANSPQTSRSNDDVDVLDPLIPDRDVQDVALGVRMTQRTASPINSVTSVALPMVDFQTAYDVVPLEFSSDCSAYDDCYARVDVPWGPLGGLDCGYFEPSVVETHCHFQDASWSPSAGLECDDVGHALMEGSYDPLAGYEDDLEASVAEVAGYDPGDGHVCDPWSVPVCEDGGSTCYSEQDGVPGFLEGRALLLGIPEQPPYGGLSGLAQAEVDVARRLRDHWRPLRLS